MEVLNHLSPKKTREVASKKNQEVEAIFVFLQHSFSTMLQVLQANRESVPLILFCGNILSENCEFGDYPPIECAYHLLGDAGLPRELP